MYEYLAKVEFLPMSVIVATSMTVIGLRDC
jgi:hypothetical protein